MQLCIRGSDFFSPFSLSHSLQSSWSLGTRFHFCKDNYLIKKKQAIFSLLLLIHAKLFDCDSGRKHTVHAAAGNYPVHGVGTFVFRGYSVQNKGVLAIYTNI